MNRAKTRPHKVALPEFPGDYPREILLVDVVIDGRPLLVANTHLAYRFEMVEERRIQTDAVLAALKQHASASPDAAKVLCGDFNDDPDSPAIRALLESEEHLRDAYAECHPNSAGFTFVRRNKYVDPIFWAKDQRIDYVFINRELSPRDCTVVFDATDGLEPASDHYGVFCQLDFR